MFRINSKFKPSGDQPQAIQKLVSGLQKGYKYQTLLGVTGSGKTFTMANVIQRIKKPTLVIAHNKTLAAQLCNEFRIFFPESAVEYFVSYYDYYQPEAYMPRTDTYIEKEAQINNEIDRLRHAATTALFSRKDVVIVASVSCIYGLGSPENYRDEILHIKLGDKIDRSSLMRRLVNLHFARTSLDLERGQFRARGAVIEIAPIDLEVVYRFEIQGNKVSKISIVDRVTRKTKGSPEDIWVFPARHFIVSDREKETAIKQIKMELKDRLRYFRKKSLLLEAERLERRTKYDIEMINEIGYCSGIENYSRYFSGRSPGDPPSTLLSYFPSDFLMFIDESHVTIPQINGMHNGDRARKKPLVEFGFRLPSAFDNRPLKFNEFEERVNQCIFFSATPGQYEIEKSKQVVEQIIRPTGLVDPEIDIRPITEKQDRPSQVKDLIKEVKKRVLLKERTLVTTLTKKMAEDLSEYLKEQNIKSKYLHSNIDTLDRIKILTEFRQGKFDCLVGVNLLREGLDLPEVTLVAILDADKEGFLRSETSLIQTIGRAARNVRGKVILYADRLTGSMKKAVKETERRRKKQIAYNKKHGITPETIIKEVRDIVGDLYKKDIGSVLETELKISPCSIDRVIEQKEKEMTEAAKNLEFELAAVLRDQIKELKKNLSKQRKGL